MTLKERYRLTFEYFTSIRPVVETELEWKDPFELIVAVILSAQCTDKRVNMITPALLEKYPGYRRGRFYRLEFREISPATGAAGAGGNSGRPDVRGQPGEFEGSFRAGEAYVYPGRYLRPPPGG